MELLPGERLVATARFDLDRDLRFTEGWLALTDRRLLGDTPASADGATTSPHGFHRCVRNRGALALFLHFPHCVDIENNVPVALS